MTEQELTNEEIRIEQFAHSWAYGMPMRECLRSAGFKDLSVGFGMSLLKRDDVQRIIDGDRDWIKSKLVASIDSIAQQLDRDREFAYSCENPSAAIQASMNKAKLLGFMDNDKKNMPKSITIVWDDDEEPGSE